MVIYFKNMRVDIAQEKLAVVSSKTQEFAAALLSQDSGKVQRMLQDLDVVGTMAIDSDAMAQLEKVHLNVNGVQLLGMVAAAALNAELAH